MDLTTFRFDIELVGVTSPPIGLDFRNRTCHEHLLLIFKPTEILCKKGHVKILFFVCVNIDLARGGSSRISLPTSEAHTIKKMLPMMMWFVVSNMLFMVNPSMMTPNSSLTVFIRKVAKQTD